MTLNSKMYGFNFLAGKESGFCFLVCKRCTCRRRWQIFAHQVNISGSIDQGDSKVNYLHKSIVCL